MARVTMSERQFRGEYNVYVDGVKVGRAWADNDRHWHAGKDLMANVRGMPHGKLYGCAEDVREEVERVLEFPNVYERPYEEFIEGMKEENNG